MKANRQRFDDLIARRGIRIRRGSLFDVSLPSKPPEFDFGRVEGMLLGLAIGDALGNRTESLLPEDRTISGDIRDYGGSKRIGLPSDDTQLAYWTLEQLIADEGYVPEHVAASFCNRRIFGLGMTVREFIGNFKGGKPWYECGPESAGNGALMRIAPMVVPHLRAGGSDLWIDTALCAMTTHNDSMSIAACVSFVAMLWDLLDMKQPPAPEWYLERYIQAAMDLETGEFYSPRGGDFMDYSGPGWSFVEEKVGWAWSRGLSVLNACNAWHSGAFLMETVPCLIYILMRHGRDFEEAIVRAVNDTKDNDTTAAIVGAAVGALHGKAAIPPRWIQGLAGRTTDSDDGRVFELLSQARDAFWEKSRQNGYDQNG